jgi:hypothetical protein
VLKLYQIFKPTEVLKAETACVADEKLFIAIPASAHAKFPHIFLTNIPVCHISTDVPISIFIIF